MYRSFKLDVIEAEVIARLSRVSVLAETDGVRFLCHLRNTGRLHDYIYQGARILVQPNPRGKTHAIVIGAPYGERAAILDTYTQARCFEDACINNVVSWLKPHRIDEKEITVYGSRIDYGLKDNAGRRGYLELKSAVYLDKDRYAMYPDSPSLRGRRHVETLMRIAKRSRAVISFVAAHPDAIGFKPCVEGDPIMSELLRKANRMGVEMHAVKMFMTLDGSVIFAEDDIPIKLD